MLFSYHLFIFIVNPRFFFVIAMLFFVSFPFSPDIPNGEKNVSHTYNIAWIYVALVFYLLFVCIVSLSIFVCLLLAHNKIVSRRISLSISFRLRFCGASVLSLNQCYSNVVRTKISSSRMRSCLAKIIRFHSGYSEQLLKSANEA